MTDDELEQLLGRQQFTAPHPLLRTRVLDTATGEPRRVRLGIVDYAMVAVAAGLILAVTLIDVPANPPWGAASRQREISDVARALGGGQEATRYAEIVVLRKDEATDPFVTEAAW